MRKELLAVLAAGAFLAAAQGLCAQSTTAPKTPPTAPTPAQNAPAQIGSTQNGSGQNGSGESNPFPGSATSVPILPNTPGAFAEPSADAAAGARVHLPSSDLDPVASPDDDTTADSGSTSGFSDSSTGLDQLLQPPPDQGKPGKGSAAPVAPVETAAQDISVGNYYLSTRDWKGALSRFESALVLASDNPDVFWGLAECQRHLGQFAEARTNYIKVMEYDPDSKHSKDARKYLKQPELAHATQGAPAAR
ncbi:MAG TPA: tetratricopeptide repeat protein [Terracidiphilus sp.]|nr:tetratricopeptide repeat protein [Terracidiphilus sp.]